MKTASVATMQHDLKKILAQVEHGATYQITRHGRPVAYLSASLPKAEAPVAVAGRSRKGPVKNPCLGALAGTVRYVGDIVGPEPDDWEANQ